MTAQQLSPMVKLEASPAESFLSLPEDNYSSLFAPTTPSAAINPFDIMTPQSTCTDRQTSQLPVISEEQENTTSSPEDDTSGKKQTKKRKSWGQVLPEPKTNLPPRKRAKTDDEKEQRRVERVLRNRRAAQSSRERKRLEVEALEIRNQELENQLMKAQKTNMYLMEELKRVRRDSGVTTPVSSPLNPLYDTPLALSQELFSSHDNTSGDPAVHLVDELITSTANPTVNPASLSPELTPVPDDPNTESHFKSESSEETSSTSPDLTQHPAEILGHPFGLSAAIDTDRRILESGLLASPDPSVAGDDYLAGDCTADLSSPSHFEFFNMDDFVSDEANNVVSDIMAASDYVAADHGFEPTVHDFETQVPFEHSCLQPQSGASLIGCDDGGLAVSV
ncbi:hypothetical protein E4U37_002941 [Claviceps purpurea]|nr:hypothetical protein E4U37_002941 [Claviceps purpurea]